MTFAAELLHFPDLFPVRHSGERWGERELALDFAGGPYRLRGLSRRQEEGLRRRFALPAAGGGAGDRDAVEVRIFRAPASDFRDPEPAPWRDYPLELAPAPDSVRLASRRFLGRLDWRSGRLRGALWTPVDGPAAELVGVFENFLRVLAAYRLNELGGVLLHSAGVVDRGKAYLFVGPSGAGKTTLARVSRSDGKTVLSDDVNVVRLAEGLPVAENLPFAGDLGQVPAAVGVFPVAGIFGLEKAAEPCRRPLATAPALAMLIAGSPFLNGDPHRLDRLTANLAALLELLPAEILGFAPDPGFWRLLDDRG